MTTDQQKITRLSKKAAFDGTQTLQRLHVCRTERTVGPGVGASAQDGRLAGEAEAGLVTDAAANAGSGADAGRSRLTLLLASCAACTCRKLELYFLIRHQSTQVARRKLSQALMSQAGDEVVFNGRTVTTGSAEAS